MMFKGQKYDYMLENLEDKTFQLKELYSVGFAWSDLIPKLSYESELSEKLKQSIVLLYGERYLEYYTRLYLAKSITFAHFIITAVAIIGCLMQDVTGLFIFVVGVAAGYMIGKTYINEPKQNVQARADECIMEFPNLVTKLALLLNSGITLREAWFLAAETTQGPLSDLMQDSCELMRNGKSDYDAIYSFGVKSGSNEIRKFSVSITQSLEKGNSELAEAMMQQSNELWDIKKQRLLQKGEQAATKLVIPTTLMFVGVILVVLSSALTGMSF